jgi:REP element-mobilizing transposase RayT
MNHSRGNLKHTKWDCKYHVVFIPKYRRKNMGGSAPSWDRSSGS